VPTAVLGFPNQFFSDSWVVGLEADHGWGDTGLDKGP
jgi:hypothetical protein